jgi:hypothetical protein
MKPVLIPATRELAEAYYGQKPPHTFQGLICVDEGRPLGVCGLYRDEGHVFAFSEFSEELRPHRRVLVQAVRAMVDMMDASPVTVFAIENREEPLAADLLRRVGFVPTGAEVPGGRVMVRAT